MAKKKTKKRDNSAAIQRELGLKGIIVKITDICALALEVDAAVEAGKTPEDAAREICPKYDAKGT